MAETVRNLSLRVYVGAASAFRDRKLPRREVLEMFRAGYDTLEIGRLLMVHESSVVSALHAARNAERKHG